MHAATAWRASSGVLVKGNMTPSTPASSTRLAVQISLTGTRAKGRAFSPRVARTMLRKLSSVMGLCSISIHRKSNPRLAACAAISALPTVRVIPTAGFPSRSSFFTGFSHPSCGLVFLVGIKTLLCPVDTYQEFLVYRILVFPATLNPWRLRILMAQRGLALRRKGEVANSSAPGNVAASPCRASCAP
ncbi:hypothetical protein SBA2_150007 [Acidobacteriia bacterium SbA2]|nr:hypothetical protein SBA2_150007 [Acidobacteriia bacterium SbA2]